MKAIVKQSPEPGLNLEERPIPEIREDEVLIKIHKSAICGTDLHIYKWDSWSQKNVPTPLIIGHEFMGHIVQIGSKVHRFKVGDRVSGEGHLTCDECLSCRHGKRHLCVKTRGVGYHVTGCFAEYFALREKNVVLLPSDIPDDVAAIFDPLGNSVHTALSFDLAGEDVLITGAGPVGIMAASVCKQAGARHVVITDTNQYRLALAQKMGVSASVCVPKESIDETMHSLGMENGFMVGLEMSGSCQALNDIVTHLQPGGGVGLLGFLPPECTIDWDLVIFKMITIKGIYGREIFSTWDKMIHLLQGGMNIAPVITHHFAADQFQQAFETALSGKAGKIILEW
jgi:threonine 3-dehydrogenase